MPARVNKKLHTSLEQIASRLRDRCDLLNFNASVAYTYNPLQYAWGAHCAFLARAHAQPHVLFVGMNPGPCGMAQTGVPFGEVAQSMALLARVVRSVALECGHGRNNALVPPISSFTKPSSGTGVHWRL